MGKFNSKVEQIESRTASWNGLCSTFEGPLYFIIMSDVAAYHVFVCVLYPVQGGMWTHVYYVQTVRQISIWYVPHILKFTTKPPLQSSKFSTVPIQNTFNFVCDYTVSPFSSNDLLRNNFHLTLGIYRVYQEEWTKLRESVPYVKLYRYNPKHLYPKLNGYGDNGHRKVWASGVSMYCKPSVTPYSSTAHAWQRETTS